MKEEKYITYHRKPTAYEIRRGYGAIHYRDFPMSECIKGTNKDGLTILKKRIKGKDDQLIYTR